MTDPETTPDSDSDGDPDSGTEVEVTSDSEDGPDSGVEAGDEDEVESGSRTGTDLADSIDLEHAERVRVGVTRGETASSIGPPREYPDRADVSITEIESTGRADERKPTDRIALSIDTMAGDHATGNVDVELTIEEARAVRDLLEETVGSLTTD